MRSPTRALLLLACTLRCAAAPPSCEPWQDGYSGQDANGPHVLGYWRFDDEAGVADSSANGHGLKLAGAGRAPAGIRGGALESFPGMRERHAALADPRAALSPKGAFSIELWLKPKPDAPGEQGMVLVDKKYVAHADYQLRLTPADKGGARRMEVQLGFGDDSDTFRSDLLKLDPNAWQHLAFTYDAAGTMRFFRNGAPAGTVRKPARGPITTGKHGLSIGDRVGSNYAGFAGYIDEVRICNGALEFRPLAVSFENERSVWRRMESANAIKVSVHNLSRHPIEAAELELSAVGTEAKRLIIDKLGPGETRVLDQPIDTRLRPGTYAISARLKAMARLAYTSEEHGEYTIVARPLPHRMPVMMWGIGGNAVEREMPRLKQIGFTHSLGGGADYSAIWEAKSPVAPGKPEAIAETKRMLDFALANDFGIAFTLSPGGWLKERAELQRVDRAGKPYARSDVNASLPGLVPFCENVGKSVANTFKAFPAWQAALINTEVRDSSQISFSEHDREACRKATGADIPAEVATKSGVDWTKLKDFPRDRIVPDEHPLLRFYRWFWTEGDGWNSLHSAVHRGLKSSGRSDVWTWFDPAIRAPSIPGSGGEVDVLGQWTYSYPDPLRIGFFTDELLAQAAASEREQRVMKMTQLIWYRSRTAPKKEGVKHVSSPFDDHDPDAAYITIAPMHLREAFWSKIARPISGLMYHGWESLVPTDGTSAYRYTHPETQHELQRLLRGIVEPLGPTLLQVPDAVKDVAYLDSFTAQMFARRGSYGYGSDEAYLTLLYAQLQPQVIFEDDVVKHGLSRFKVLVLADCDVLRSSVAQQIREFQANGGLIVGDENLAPGVMADIVIPKLKRTDRADADKAALLANAAKLRGLLDAKYRRHVDSSNPEIVLRTRRAGESDYVFAVNDRREFGDYVGQHGMVMENGLPAEADLSIRREGFIYDLVGQRSIATEARDGQQRWRAALGPAEGAIYLITPKPISGVRVDAPESATRGGLARVSIAVVDPSAQPIAAIVPVKVEISDPAGRPAEFSGYYGAADGKLAIALDLAPNDSPGMWQVKVRELASGRETTRWFRVLP